MNLLLLDDAQLEAISVVASIAASHIADVESGIAEGAYVAADNADLPKKNAALADIRRLQAGWTRWRADQEEYASEIAVARKEYAEPSDDDIEIDEAPALSISDGGVWVQAWVWVRREGRK